MAEGFSPILPHLIQSDSHLDEEEEEEEDDEGLTDEEDSLHNEKNSCNDVRDGLMQSSSEDISKQEWKSENGSDIASSSDSFVVQKVPSSKSKQLSTNTIRTFPLTHQELLRSHSNRRSSFGVPRRQEEEEKSEEENEDEDDDGSSYALKSIKSEPDITNQNENSKKKKSRHKIWKKLLPPWSSVVKTNVKIHSTSSRCHRSTIPQTVISENTTLVPAPVPALVPQPPPTSPQQDNNHTRQVSSLSTTPFASLEEDVADFIFDTVVRSSTNANVTEHLRKEREQQNAYKVEKLHQQQQKQKLYVIRDGNHVETTTAVPLNDHKTKNPNQPIHSAKETNSKQRYSTFKAKDNKTPIVFDGNIDEYYLQLRAANNDIKKDTSILSKSAQAPQDQECVFSSSPPHFERSTSEPKIEQYYLERCVANGDTTKDIPPSTTPSSMPESHNQGDPISFLPTPFERSISEPTPYVTHNNIVQDYWQQHTASIDIKQDIQPVISSNAMMEPRNRKDQFSTSPLHFERSTCEPAQSHNNTKSKHPAFTPAFTSYFDHHQQMLIAGEQNHDDNDTKQHKRGGSGRSSRQLHRRYFSLQREELEMVLQANDSLDEQKEKTMTSTHSESVSSATASIYDNKRNDV